MKKSIDVLTIALVVASFAAGAGCGPKQSAPPSSGGGGSTPAASGTPEEDEAPDTGGSLAAPKDGTAAIKGKVTLKGTPPVMPNLLGLDGKPECADQHTTPPKAEVVITGAGGALVNAFVYISKGVQGKYPVPSEPVKFDQAKCIYHPHVLGVQTGQEVQINNGDPALHNVHILPKPGIRELNSGQAPGSPPIKTKFGKAALGISVKCDVHPWMQAYACVSDHPFFAVTGADGTFSLPPKLPAGSYTVTAWHEKYGTVDQQVTVADGEAKTIAFEFGG